MNDNAKVSVIVPNYNHSIYLKQRIDTILSQTYQDFELIILDDCSTDNSREIIDGYKNHPKVSCIVYNEQNSGSVFRQWKKGIELARGEYVWIAESDDWAESDFLSEMLPVLVKNDSVGFVSSDSLVEDATGKAHTLSAYLKKKYNDNRWESDYIHKGKDEINEVMVYNCTIGNVSSVLFRKSDLVNAKPFDIPLRYSGDWYCYLKIASIADVAYVNKPLNHFRRHASSTSFSAGYSYLIELFLIYNWILSVPVINDKNLIRTGLNRYVSDVYSSGLKWKPLKDLKELFPINKRLYIIMTWKLFKRKVRSTLFRLKK